MLTQVTDSIEKNDWPIIHGKIILSKTSGLRN